MSPNEYTNVFEICRFVRKNKDFFKRPQDIPTKYVLWYENRCCSVD